MHRTTWFGIVLTAIVGTVVLVLAGWTPQTEAAELLGGGSPPGGNKTVFDCPRPYGLGHSEILVGFSGAETVWARYCAFPYWDRAGLTYAKFYESFWKAETRENGDSQTTPFYQGEIVLLADRDTIAYYGTNWWEETIQVSGPCFFMRSKSHGVVTGKAWINPSLEKVKGVPYCAASQLPPPADFLLPTPLWFDIAAAVKKESCWEWNDKVLIFPECIKLPEESEKLSTTIKAPYAPIPPAPKGVLSPQEIRELWCVAGFCNNPWRFLYPEEKGTINKNIVLITPGTGLAISLPQNVWATYSPGRDEKGNRVYWTALGPQVIYAEEAMIRKN